MARRVNYKPYFFLIAFFFVIMSLNKQDTGKMRQMTIGLVIPTWKCIDTLKAKVLSFLTLPPIKGGSLSSKKELEQLALENLAMKNQIEHFRSYLLFEDCLEDQWQRFKEVSSREEKEVFWKEFFRRRSEYLCENLQMQYQSLGAKVIFREPVSWSSSFWLNVGEKDNEALGKTIVAKNSPVVIGTTIVGLVEHVAEQKCRVRLITDPGLVCSVRAMRGGEQDRVLMQHIDALISQIGVREDLWSSGEEAKNGMQILTQLKSRLNPHLRDEYMAKGELSGTGHALWRTQSTILKGVGFNYDFSDKEGPARDLRTGKPVDASSPLPPCYLLKIGDLLVTTGMDGVFPPDFKVAVVTKIHPLREGGCSYDIEAESMIENLQNIKEVFILPPVSFCETNK